MDYANMDFWRFRMKLYEVRIATVKSRRLWRGFWIIYVNFPVIVNETLFHRVIFCTDMMSQSQTKGRSLTFLCVCLIVFWQSGRVLGEYLVKDPSLSRRNWSLNLHSIWVCTLIFWCLECKKFLKMRISTEFN